MPKRRVMMCVTPDLRDPHVPIIGQWGVHKNGVYEVESMDMRDLVKVYDRNTGTLLVAGLSIKRFKPLDQSRKPLEHWE